MILVLDEFAIDRQVGPQPLGLGTHARQFQVVDRVDQIVDFGRVDFLGLVVEPFQFPRPIHIPLYRGGMNDAEK